MMRTIPLRWSTRQGNILLYKMHPLQFFWSVRGGSAFEQGRDTEVIHASSVESIELVSSSYLNQYIQLNQIK